MLVDKEYPATHSMSTSWYIVDEDGNVGIMDFNANGPVPWGTDETVSEDLVWGLDSDKVDLTEEQILYALGESYTPEEVDDYSDCIIQIDKSRKELFESLCKDGGFEIDVCYSESFGLYEVPYRIWLESKSDNVECLHEETIWQKLLENHIIKRVYKKPDLYIDEEYRDGKWIPSLNFEKMPYYLYWQPYSSIQLSELVNKPDCPVKISQLSESMQKRAFHLPIKFDNTPKIQIAEFIPCAVNDINESGIECINGCEYGLLPLSNGQMAYCLLSIEGHDLDTLPPLPYQSKEYPLVISVEEMKRLKGL